MADYDAVLETIDALEDHATSPTMTWYKAKVMYEQEAYEQAVTLYRSVESVFSEDVSFVREWATLLVEEGRRDEAIRVIEQSLAQVVDVEDRQMLEEERQQLME